MKRTRIELSDVLLFAKGAGVGSLLTVLLWKGVGLTGPEVLSAILGVVGLLLGGVAYVESRDTTQAIREIQAAIDIQAKPLDQLFQLQTNWMQLNINRQAERGGELQVPPSGSSG